MKAFIAFSQKELLEAIRTYKLLIMISVFLLIGLMNPINAKFTPQIIKSFLPKDMHLTLPEPSALDSWAQFYKNVPQLGLIVLVIVFSSLMSNELSKGTLINVITKGLPRQTAILSKLATSTLIWTVSYFICYIVTYLYTIYFWDTSKLHHVFFSAVCLWIFGILILSIEIFGGVLFVNSYGSMLLTAFIIALMLIINVVNVVKKYNPISLANNLPIISGTTSISNTMPSIAVCLILIIMLVISSITIFNKSLALNKH